MRMVTILLSLVLLLAARPLAADEKDAKVEKFDPAKLVGTWKYTAGVKNGENVDKDRLKAGTVVFTKDNLTLKGEMTFVIKYELDTKKSPVGIKMTITESPFGAGAMSEGVIELKGDTLKMCYAPMPGGAAPKAFEAKEGSNFHFFTLERSK